MQTHDVAQYITQNVARPQFYIEDILPKQGVMLLYGEPKVKKSFLAEHMGFSMAQGSEWLGFRTEQAKVFIANFEISPIAYHWRLKDMSRHFNLQDNMFFEGTQMLMFLDDDEQFNIFMSLLRNIEPQIIILDCLAMCYGGDENNGEHMARFIQKLSLMKAEFNASIIIVHHTNKNMLAASSVDKARGHSRLAGWVDTLVYIAPQPVGVQLQFKARQATRELRNLNVVFEDYNWRLR